MHIYKYVPILSVNSKTLLKSIVLLGSLKVPRNVFQNSKDKVTSLLISSTKF